MTCSVGMLCNAVGLSRVARSLEMFSRTFCFSRNTVDHVSTVEFILAPQHKTSCNPEITTKEDFDYLKKVTSKFTDGFTSSQKKLNTKQRLKILTFQNIVMRI